jgi:two-component system, NarL family, sensor kinase
MSGSWCVCTEAFQRGRLNPTNVEILGCSRLLEAYRQRVPEAALGLRYHASIPLYFQDRPLGIINVTGPSDRKLSDADLRLLATIAYQVGIAVERARLAEESTLLARAEERTRLAREIHDTLAQDLTAIGLDIEGALRHLEDQPEQARERLQRALATSRASLEEARRSVLDLRAGPLEGRPLPEALAALSRAFTSETGVQVRFSTDYSQLLPSRFEAELYRVAQEALANVRKHAGATAVDMELRASDRGVVLLLADNGAGFDPDREPGDGQGLRGMRERVRLLAGRLRVQSRPGRGTKITVHVPLTEQETP